MAARIIFRRRRGKILIDRFKNTLHRRTVRLMKGAINAFLTEASKNIRIDTGMSLASLMPIARFVGLAEFGLIAGGRTRKGAMIGFDRGVFNRSLTQGVTLGQQLGEDAFEVNLGSSNRFVMKFSFEAVVFQHILNDLGLGGTPALNSIQKGRQAFLRYIVDNADEIAPKFREYIQIA